MPWIESHTELIRHWKLTGLAESLRICPAYALGHLHALWHTSLEQRPDGDLSVWNDKTIASASQFRGDAAEFVRLLVSYRWLGYFDSRGVIPGTEKLIHDWLDYAGRYLAESKFKRDPQKLTTVRRLHSPVRGLSLDIPGTVPDTIPTRPDQPTNQPTGAVERRVELPAGFPESPDDAVKQAAFVGCGVLFATKVWNAAMARDGHDSKGQPIRSFRHHLAAAWAYEQDRVGRGENKPATNGADTVKFNAEYERVLQRMAAIKGTYGDHQTWIEPDRAEWKVLVARKKELKGILGITV